MKFFKRLTGLILMTLMFSALYFICNYFGVNAKSFYMDTPGATTRGSIDFSKTSVDKLIVNYANTEVERDIVITAVGDMKFYEWQLERAYDETTKTFDFASSFAYIESYLKNTNYLVGDIETTLAGSGNGAYTDYNGYGANRRTMLFNTPEVLADNLSHIGFDLITTANEHALDSGGTGLTTTLHHLQEAGLRVTGTRNSETDPVYMIEKISGMNTGFIAYTNVMTNTEDTESLNLVNYLDNYNEEKITQMCNQIKQMREEGAETVIVLLHFGTEYASIPEETDKNLAHRLIEAGADLILGSHPHVPGTIEVVNAKNDDGSERQGVVIYSLGNFLTSQQYVDGTDQHRDMGMICDIVFKKSKDGVRIGGINVTPVYSNWTDDDIATIPVLEAYENPDTFGDIFDEYAKPRIKAAYESIFPDLLNNSGLSYTYEDYKYKISLEN